MTSQERAFREFSDFAAKLKGDKKGEAQTFLFHLLAAFGHDPNTLPEKSTFEYRVRLPILRAIAQHPSAPCLLRQVVSRFPGAAVRTPAPIVRSN